MDKTENRLESASAEARRVVAQLKTPSADSITQRMRLQRAWYTFAVLVATLGMIGLVGSISTSRDGLEVTVTGQVQSTTTSHAEATGTDTSEMATSESAVPSVETLFGRWTLTSADVDGRPLMPDGPAFVTIESREVYANFGCAPLHAEAAIDERASEIRFQLIAVTTLGCPKTARSTQEVLLEVFLEVRSFEFRNDALCLVADTSQMCFEQDT